MDRTEIKPGMLVVCKEAHYSDDIYWATPYMDEAIGRLMTVKQISGDMIFCQFDTDYPMDDGCWFFKADWLEPYEEGEEREKSNSNYSYSSNVDRMSDGN